jgi:hypothetical protein
VRHDHDHQTPPRHRRANRRQPPPTCHVCSPTPLPPRPQRRSRPPSTGPELTGPTGGSRRHARIG